MILPLISVVEGSSWTLLGTPIFSRKFGAEESILKALKSDTASIFRSSYLLSGTSPINYKLYNRLEDTNTIIGSTTNQGNNYLLLTNARKAIFYLPKIQVLFMIA